MLSPLQVCTKVHMLYYPCNAFTVIGGTFPMLLSDVYRAEGDPIFAICVVSQTNMTEEHAKNALVLSGYPASWFDKIYPGAGIQLNRRPDDEIPDMDLILFSELNHAAYSYLISKHYDMPLWFEENHPDNGKTPIELNLATFSDPY